MYLVKSVWQNRSNKENLTYLLRVKVDGPAIEEFHPNHRGKAFSLWYNDRKRRMHQPQQEAYKNIDKTN